jgi:transcriptional regulator with XRE-family HTH domain
MTIKAYCEKEKISYAELARRCDVDPSTIHRLSTGTRVGSVDMLIKIKKATKGKVTYNDLIPEGT